MKIETMSVTGFEGAVYGMRLPMCKDLQDVMCKSDSSYEVPPYCDTRFIIGENDLKIAKNLIKADSNSSSQPNSKFLRMIHVQVAITAPLYWWKELDTYKIGTVANSTSTMHKLASTPITKDCFECGEWIPENTIKNLEGMRNCYNETKDKTVWKKLIVNLPESWLQTRMFDCDYATLRNIYTWRKNHKVTEWHTFCDWIKSLPYADDFICRAELGKTNE